jgi:hypothetical protein
MPVNSFVSGFPNSDVQFHKECDEAISRTARARCNLGHLEITACDVGVITAAKCGPESVANRTLGYRRAAFATTLSISEKPNRTSRFLLRADLDLAESRTGEH